MAGILFGKKSRINYIGGWQFGDTVRQELAGPIGEGIVEYPNGDTFKGIFHLNYAHINGPAYAAKGEYRFADGSVIEQAWIDTSDDVEVMDLIGVYPVKHPQGPDTLTPFYRHKRNGIEVVLAEKPYAVEWSEDKKLQELEMDSYDYKKIDEDRSILTVTLRDGTVIEHRSGDLELNNYNERVFKTHFESEVHNPDGSFVDGYGYSFKGLKPYDGYLTIHTANGKYHRETWRAGQRVETDEERWDYRGAKHTKLPEPFNKDHLLEAWVWDGHINYQSNTWVYDGDMKGGRPNGHGVLVGDEVDTRGRRYEGDFKDGLCHGHGVFTYPEGGIEQNGEWVEGVFQESDAPTGPVMLHVVLSGDSSDDRTIEAQVGKFPFFKGFGGLRIDRIEKQCITFSFFDEVKLLTPGETLHMHSEIEGREYSDGCVYEYYDYYLDITWKA